MNRYSKLIKELGKFCESMQCSLNITYHSDYSVCFKAVSEYTEGNPFAISIYYPDKASRNPDTKTLTHTYTLPRRATFDICSCHDEYSGGQFTRENIELLLSIDNLTDEELGLSTPSDN